MKTLTAVSNDEPLRDDDELSPAASSYATHSTRPSPSTTSATPSSSRSNLTHYQSLKESIEPPPIITSQQTTTTSRNAFFQILPSSLGGYGAFATRDLYRGDMILRERPLLISEHHHFYDKFSKLTLEQREVFEGLGVSEMRLWGTPKIKAIWDTNCFSISSTHSAIFPCASRFNHACHSVCTVSYAYEPVENCLIMRVLADHIPMGQELTISYGKSWTPLTLYLKYGFRCGCGGCEGVTDVEIQELEPSW